MLMMLIFNPENVGIYQHWGEPSIVQVLQSGRGESLQALAKI